MTAGLLILWVLREHAHNNACILLLWIGKVAQHKHAAPMPPAGRTHSQTDTPDSVHDARAAVRACLTLSASCKLPGWQLHIASDSSAKAFAAIAEAWWVQPVKKVHTACARVAEKKHTYMQSCIAEKPAKASRMVACDQPFKTLLGFRR
jgi:hypothetical protein